MKNKNKRDIKTRLRDLREDNDLTQDALARKLNITRSAYAKWECGITDFSLENADKLAKFYNVNLDYLLGISNVSTKTKYKLDINIISKRITKLRKEHKLTQDKASGEIGFVLSTYACYESGIRIPTTIKLLYIAIYYNVSFDYLVGKSNIKEIKQK